MASRDSAATHARGSRDRRLCRRLFRRGPAPSASSPDLAVARLHHFDDWRRDSRPGGLRRHRQPRLDLVQTHRATKLRRGPSGLRAERRIGGSLLWRVFPLAHSRRNPVGWFRCRCAGARSSEDGGDSEFRFASKVFFAARGRSISWAIRRRLCGGLPRAFEELSQHPKIVALRNDPEITQLIAQGRILELLHHPRVLEAANDPTVVERVKQFDLKKALEFAAKKE